MQYRHRKEPNHYRFDGEQYRISPSFWSVAWLALDLEQRFAHFRCSYPEYTIRRFENKKRYLEQQASDLATLCNYDCYGSQIADNLLWIRWA